MGVAAKICGLTSEAAVTAAVEGGAAYLGFVFYPPSPRSVSRPQAAALCAAVPAPVMRVGLFVDADDHSITAVLDLVPLDMLQFHGHESPQRVAEAKARFDIRIIKALAIASPEDLAGAADYQDVADMLLFDAKPPIRPDALPGGNGRAFDWGVVAGYAWRRPWMLSGGLTAESLPQAVRRSGAAIVDVSSGVETRPGAKDPAKIRAFLAAARGL
jgi:phosphoribosylanthranilate isomerase